MQNCISFKIHYSLDEVLKNLMLIAVTNSSSSKGYRLPTEEELEEWRREQEYWDQDEEEDEYDYEDHSSEESE